MLITKFISIMETNKQHNEALINKLEKAQQELDLIERVIANKQEKKDDHLIEWNEVDQWLHSDIIIPAIKKAIVDQDLDNF